MTTPRSLLNTRLLLLPAAALVAAPLAACGSDDTTGTDPEAATSTIAVDDAWVRATDGPMTASFGVLRNSGDTDLTVVSAATSASDMTELHEVVMEDGEMVMKEKDDGFVVPAGGEHVLEPGADHVMIMDLQQPVEPGEEVDITLTFDDGSEVSYTAQVRQAEVGDEEYVPEDDQHGDMHGDMQGDHDHGEKEGEDGDS